MTLRGQAAIAALTSPTPNLPVVTTSGSKNTTSIATREPPRFETLPIEARLMIYRKLLLVKDGKFAQKHPFRSEFRYRHLQRKYRLSTAILLVNHAIHQETLAVLYYENQLFLVKFNEEFHRGLWFINRLRKIAFSYASGPGMRDPPCPVRITHGQRPSNDWKELCKHYQWTSVVVTAAHFRRLCKFSLADKKISKYDRVES